MEIQKKACPERSRRGFTLVELMVALFILAIILIMGAAATNYTVGKLRSKKTIDINAPVRNAFDIITQKMNTANNKKTIGSVTIYGFAQLDSSGNIVTGTGVTDGALAIVNSSTSCTFIGKVGDTLKMVQNTCGSIQIPSTTIIPKNPPKARPP